MPEAREVRSFALRRSRITLSSVDDALLEETIRLSHIKISKMLANAMQLDIQGIYQSSGVTLS
jgi:hypothetical protein